MPHQQQMDRAQYHVIPMFYLQQLTPLDLKVGFLIRYLIH